MLLILLLAAVCSVALASPKGGQCYDCNYAPDGVLKNSNGTLSLTKNDVFHHCSLKTNDNANYVSKRNCISGRCFVRYDDNKLVFRGCADKWNLPWGIDTDPSRNCEPQSYQGSKWWFCDGDLCNNIDMKATCGEAPRKKEAAASGGSVVVNIEEPPKAYDPDHEVSMGDPNGGVMYAYPADPGYETVHGQEYAYWKDPPKRKRRPINRKDEGYQTRQTGPQDDVYYSRISGRPVVAEPAPRLILPEPELPPVQVEPVAIEEVPIMIEPQPEKVMGPAYAPPQSWHNSWWNYFPFSYNYKEHNAVYPFYGYYDKLHPWQSSYTAPKAEAPKPAVSSYKPDPKRTEVNVMPAQSSSSWSKSAGYMAQAPVPAPEPKYVAPAPEPSYVAPAPEPKYVIAQPQYVAPAPEPKYIVAEPKYIAPAPEPRYVAPAPEPQYIPPKVAYTKPQAVYKIEYEVPAYEPPAYEPPMYVAPEPAPEQPIEYRTFQANDEPRREYYADNGKTDTGYDRPYAYWAERNDPYEPADERGQTRLDPRVGARCFECNFAPSGYVAIPHGPPKGRFKEVGYMKCGLQTETDRLMVDQWVCPSSTCFIRRDPNGMVYRGCADRENLPFNVRPGANCRYEGKNNALWYFCNGDLCNDGQLGEDANHCGSSPPPMPQPAPQPSYVAPQQAYSVPEPAHVPPQPAYVAPEPKQTYAVQPKPQTSSFYQMMFYPGAKNQAYPRVVDTYDFQVDNEAVAYPALVSDYSYQTKYQPEPKPEPIPEPEYTPVWNPPKYEPVRPQVIPEYNPPILYEHDYPPIPPMPEYPPFQHHIEYLPKPEYQPQPEYQPAAQPEYPVMPYSPPATSMPYTPAYNPCTGNCRENPSGLFPDPSRPTHFIQCGCDIIRGTPCTCCKPYYMECPATMKFDDNVKVCVHA